MESSKQTCAECHFLMTMMEGRRCEVPQGNREKLLRNDWSWAEHHLLRCYMDVWCEDPGQDERKRKEIIVEENRPQDFCFFWRFRPGLHFPAAEMLQKREWELRQTKRSRWVTSISVMIAAASLAFNVLLGVTNFVLTLFARGRP